MPASHMLLTLLDDESWFVALIRTVLGSEVQGRYTDLEYACLPQMRVSRSHMACSSLILQIQECWNSVNLGVWILYSLNNNMLRTWDVCEKQWWVKLSTMCDWACSSVGLLPLFWRWTFLNWHQVMGMMVPRTGKPLGSATLGDQFMQWPGLSLLVFSYYG